MHARIVSRVALAGAALCLAAAVAAAETSSTATGVSRLMNPAVSLNALFLGELADRVGEANRIAIQEAELQLTSVVDPFWTADLVVGWHEEEHHEEDEEGHAEGAPHFATDIEVAVLRSTAMPAGLGLTLGKFYLPFGKHATLHTHQYPFVRAPYALQAFIGEHGLTDVGAAVDATVPGLPWWSELTVYGVDGRAEIFENGHRDLAFGARWSNLWDVSDNGTLELGGSWLTGPSAHHAYERTDLKGVDLTFKWVGDSRNDASVTASLELILPEGEEGFDAPRGMFGYVRGQIRRDWWMGFGAGYVGNEVVVSESGGDFPWTRLLDTKEVKANLVFAPSEFSALRAEVSLRDKGSTGDLRVSLQWNFTIGSHPAHLY